MQRFTFYSLALLMLIAFSGNFAFAQTCAPGDPAIPVTISGDSEICEGGDIINLFSTDPALPGGNFASTGNGLTSFGDGTAAFNPVLSGSVAVFDIWFTYNDPVSGCTYTGTTPVTVNPAPEEPSISGIPIPGIDPMVCNGDELTLTGDPGTGTFSSTIAGVITDNGDGTATFDAPLSGSVAVYDVTYEVTNAAGCTNSVTEEIIVFDCGDECPTLFTSSVSSNDACNGDILTFSATLLPMDGSALVEVYNGANLITALSDNGAGVWTGSTLAMNSGCAPETVDYTIQVTCADGSISSTQMEDVTVYPSDLNQFITAAQTGDGCTTTVSVDPACNGFLTVDGPSTITAGAGTSGNLEFCFNYFSNSSLCVGDFCIDVAYDCEEEPVVCTDDAGVMSSALQTACAGEIINAPVAGANVAAGSILVYVIHDGQFNVGNIYASSTTGVFANDGSIPTNIQLYVSAVVGPPGANGLPDLTNQCTDVSLPGTPVRFYDPIVINSTYLCNEVTGEFTVTFSITGGGPSYPGSDHFYTVSGVWSGQAMPGVTYTSSPIADGGTYTINVLDDGKGCDVSVTEGPVQCEKLPVELISYTGEVQDNGNLLKWVTATEINNDYFTMERSIDGINYEFMDYIDGNGNANQVISYEYLDKNAPSGISLYKLSQTDFDGTTVVVGIVELQRGDYTFDIVNILPNPAINEMEIYISSNEPSEVTIQVIDAIGRTIEARTYQVGYDVTSIPMNVADYVPGIYFLNVIMDNEVKTQKFIKQ